MKLRIENPCVASSILAPGTTLLCMKTRAKARTRMQARQSTTRRVLRSALVGLTRSLDVLTPPIHPTTAQTSGISGGAIGSSMVQLARRPRCNEVRSNV